MIVTLGALLILLQTPSPEAIQHAQAGAAAEQEGRLDVAAAEFNKEIELAPGMASGYASLGGVYFRKGDYAAAIPRLKHALELNENLVAAHQILGVILLIQGDAAGALPHIEKAPTPELLGLAYLETNQLGPALTSFQTALRRQPNDPDLLYYFGHAASIASRQASERLAKIKPDAAPVHEPANANIQISDLESIEKALIEKPDDPGRLTQFAQATAATAKQAFDQLAADHPDSGRAHQIAAERYAAEGKIAEAETEYAQSIRLQPNASGVHLAFGKVLAIGGSLGPALREFRAECGLRPASAEAFFYTGFTLLQLGQAKDALAELAHADQLRPDTPDILLALGKAASGAGDPGQAEKTFTRLLNTDLDKQAREELEKVHRRMNKTDEVH